MSTFNTGKVTSMIKMFADSKATSLDVSNFDTSIVRYMGGMFHNAEATVINVSGLDTGNVENFTLNNEECPQLQASAKWGLNSF